MKEGLHDVKRWTFRELLTAMAILDDLDRRERRAKAEAAAAQRKAAQ